MVLPLGSSKSVINVMFVELAFEALVQKNYSYTTFTI